MNGAAFLALSGRPDVDTCEMVRFQLTMVRSRGSRRSGNGAPRVASIRGPPSLRTMTAEAQPEDRSSPVGLPLVVVLTVETSESPQALRDLVEVPRFQDLLRPTLESLKDLGGSARIDEIVEAVVEREGFTEEQQAVKRSPGHSMSALEYRLAWARNYLKNIGAIENSRGRVGDQRRRPAHE